MSELAIDRQAATETCAHCGSAHAVSRGGIYEDGVPFGLYIAGMHGCHGDRIVALTVAVARPHGQRPSAITIQVMPAEANFEMRIVPPERSPWRSHAYLGQMLTREEANASPLRKVFFDIADLVVDVNPEVNMFLSG